MVLAHLAEGLPGTTSTTSCNSPPHVCVPCAMSCWLLEDWSYSSTCQVRSCLCLTAGNAVTQLLLTEVLATLYRSLLFPSNPVGLLYHQCGAFSAFQKVIALSQVPLSSSVTLIHAAMAGGSTAHRADIQKQLFRRTNTQMHHL